MTNAIPVPAVELFAGSPPQAAFDLRHDVFVLEQGIDPALEYDGRDADADHAVIFGEAGEALATARLLDPPGPRRYANPTGEPVGVIGRVAVRATERGGGLGRLVTAALEARARERGLAAVELHAQAYVRDFYARQGYAVVGEPDVVAGIDHVWMRRELLPGLRRVLDADGPALQRLIGTVWAEYPGCVLDVDGEEPWLRAPGAAYAAGVEGQPRRAMWVLPGDKIADVVADADVDVDKDAAKTVVGCVALRERPALESGTGPSSELSTERTSACELKSLYVAAAVRRRGIGAALVRRVEREARQWGHERLVLWTDTRFTDAHRLYMRLGYALTGRSRDLHDLSATTELEFQRTLPAIRGL